SHPRSPKHAGHVSVRESKPDTAAGPQMIRSPLSPQVRRFAQKNGVEVARRMAVSTSQALELGRDDGEASRSDGTVATLFSDPVHCQYRASAPLRFDREPDAHRAPN